MDTADLLPDIDESNLQKHVKVALIDDGVQSNYAGLNDNIKSGAIFFQAASNQRFSQNYNTSLYDHGTVMAYYICRVCPNVRLHVAKLDGKQRARGVSFSIQSVIDVS